MFHVLLILGWPIFFILLLVFLFSLSTENEKLREKIWKPLKKISLIMLVLSALAIMTSYLLELLMP